MSYVLPRLTRTLQSFFRIGNIRISDASGVVALRNAAGTAYVPAETNTLRLNDGDSNFASLTSPALSQNLTFVLPSGYGSSGQVLTTDGAGNLSFADAASGDTFIAYSTAFSQTTSSVVLVQEAFDIEIYEVIVSVASTNGAGTPTLAMSYGSPPNLFIQTTDSDLKEAGDYVIQLSQVVQANDAVNLNVVAGGGVFSGNLYMKYRKAN